jgi:hypothetical protein
VLELVLNVRGAPPAEREAKLAPFRAASEAEGLNLLDAPRRALLEQVRLRKAAVGRGVGLLRLAKPLFQESARLLVHADVLP